MAELRPSTCGNVPIEKLGLALLIADATSHVPIPLTGPVVEIQHSESYQNAPHVKSDSTAVVMAEESAITVNLGNALETDLRQLTIEQAEIETARERLRATDEEGRDEAKVNSDNLHEENNGKDPQSVEDENENGRKVKPDNLHEEKHEKNPEVVEKIAKLDDFHEEKGRKNAEAVESENMNGWGYMENQRIPKLDDFHEDKAGKNAEGVENENNNGWGNIENEGLSKLYHLHEKKGGKNAESFEDGNVSGWGYLENRGAVKLDNLYEEMSGRNAGNFELENVNRCGFIEKHAAMKLDNNMYEENRGRNVKNVEDQFENRWGNMENGGDFGTKPGDAVTNSGRYNPSNNTRMVIYPMRPDAEDCAFYMRFGSCKFGSNCKFNHPPKRKNQGVRERVNHNEEYSERAECTYYLTSGGCKYGKDCRYSHGSDKSSKSQNLEFNFLGLPLRSGEKECTYYMRTGTCKYGSNCRFHHPEPATVVGANSSSRHDNVGPSQYVSSSSISSWSSPNAYHETSDPNWNGYQAACYPTSERSIPTPPAFALVNEISFSMPHQQDMILEEYPERPGEPECGFFMKTGDCKFKSSCKFHHPNYRISKSSASSSCTLNDKGLPLRPDEPICTFYHRYGICKYGPACKYDHPSNFAF